MPEFTLPSGRVVETHEPTYGAVVHAIAIGMKNTEEFHYAKFAAVIPGLTREEVEALSRKDGIALATEVNRLFDGRPDDQEAPFANGSPGASTEELLEATPKPNSA